MNDDSDEEPTAISNLKGHADHKCNSHFYRAADNTIKKNSKNDLWTNYILAEEINSGEAKYLDVEIV